MLKMFLFFIQAQYWYDIMDIPENVTKFDYGLKITTKNAEEGKIRYICGV